MSEALGVALLALTGVLLAQSVVVWVCLRTTGVAVLAGTQAQQRWHREQRISMLRWAAELGLEPEPQRSATGVAVLDALMSDAIDAEDRPIFRAVLETVTSGVDYPGPDDSQGGGS